MVTSILQIPFSFKINLLGARIMRFPQKDMSFPAFILIQLTIQLLSKLDIFIIKHST